MIFETVDKPHWITSQPQIDDVAIIQLIQYWNQCNFCITRKITVHKYITTNVVCSKNRSTWVPSVSSFPYELHLHEQWK